VAKPLVVLGLAAAVAAVASTVMATAATAAPTGGEIREAGGPTAIVDSYIVVFHNNSVDGGAVPGKARDLAARVGSRVGHTYSHALRGFEVNASEELRVQDAAAADVGFINSWTLTL
jgi:hypothetical protein